MSLPEFTWFPDVGSQQNCDPRVQSTKFGDGYELRVPIGINHMPMKWSLTFDRSREEAAAILAFLRERGGYLAFTWTNPLEEPGTYVCRKWSTASNRGALRVSCEFEQVFEY